jgi:hypothetical protein
MDNKIIFWCAVAGIGALLGAFLRISTVGKLLAALVVIAFAGGFGAAFLGWIRPEWLYLLMLVLPVAGALFASAAVSNTLLGPKK